MTNSLHLLYLVVFLIIGIQWYRGWQGGGTSFVRTQLIVLIALSVFAWIVGYKYSGEGTVRGGPNGKKIPVWDNMLNGYMVMLSCLMSRTIDPNKVTWHF